jgi:hypothetical protein
VQSTNTTFITHADGSIDIIRQTPDGLSTTTISAEGDKTTVTERSGGCSESATGASCITHLTVETPRPFGWADVADFFDPGSGMGTALFAAVHPDEDVRASAAGMMLEAASRSAIALAMNKLVGLMTPKRGITVFGTYPNNAIKAGRIDANYSHLSPAAWEAMTADEQAAYVFRFAEAAWQRGDRILLSDPFGSYPTRWFDYELSWFVRRGGVPSSNGMEILRRGAAGTQ